MSVDKCQEQNESSGDISWGTLIADTEGEIEKAKIKIRELSSSLRFFKRKQQLGEPFPSVQRNG